MFTWPSISWFVAVYFPAKILKFSLPSYVTYLPTSTCSLDQVLVGLLLPTSVFYASVWNLEWPRFKIWSVYSLDLWDILGFLFFVYYHGLCHIQIWTEQLKAMCRYSVLYVIILECFLSSVNSNLLMCWFLVSYLLGRLLLPEINLHLSNFIIYATVVYVLGTR